MKTTLLYCSFFICTLLGMQAQPFQNNVSLSSEHYHDINTELINDGSDDYVVAANAFDASMMNEQILLQRLDTSGNIVWMNTYSDPTLPHARSFDITTRQGVGIIMTGSVDVGGVKKVFIAIFDATTGAMTSANYFDIVSPNFNSRGLKISFTNADADGDTMPDAGYIVSGFFSDCYNVDINCTNNNIGFVLRVDLLLNPFWVVEIDASNTINSLDYDFANGITETDDGYFITGSATGTTTGGTIQQAVLAHKIDFTGNFIWDNSYIYGNSQDVSVDSYYDAATDKIYMLTNYSVSHYFGVTTIDDTAAGPIDFSRSWYAFDPNELNRYGFSIRESFNSPNNLVISGYDRSENWVNTGGVSQYGETNIFVYEFEKATGNQVGNAYQYLVPNVEPAGDDFNFWLFQMPLMYYPDISFTRLNDTGVPYYYHVGYRREPATGFVRNELVATTISKANKCERRSLVLNHGSITIQATPVFSGFVPVTITPFLIPQIAPAYIEDFCEEVLGTSQNSLNEIKLYPNPTRDVINISGASFSLYAIYDGLGRIVSEGRLDTSNSINVNELNTGLYFIQIKYELSEWVTIKFVKQ